jgi:transposase
MAAPRHVVTDQNRRQVKALAGMGMPVDGIARVLGIGRSTIVKYYRDDLDQGSIEANAKVAQSLFEKATGDGPSAVQAAIFWLKTRARWTEVNVHEIRGEMQMGIRPALANLSVLSTDQLRQLEAIAGDLSEALASENAEERELLEVHDAEEEEPEEEARRA